MAAELDGADLVHSHTWYANLAGHLAKLLHGVPHVATTHSLEPSRPWKAEQLGGGYRVSSWCERTGLEGADAVIAVPGAMREDVLAAYPALEAARVHVIGNGIDTEEYHRVDSRAALERYGVREPYVLFVGRITKQKGLSTLLAAAPASSKVRNSCSPPARPTRTSSRARRRRRSHASTTSSGSRRCCRSTTSSSCSRTRRCSSARRSTSRSGSSTSRRWHATPPSSRRVGGILEVVVDGETGLLVPPEEPDALARAINELVADPGARAAHGGGRPHARGRGVRLGPRRGEDRRALPQPHLDRARDDEVLRADRDRVAGQARCAARTSRSCRAAARQRGHPSPRGCAP